MHEIDFENLREGMQVLVPATLVNIYGQPGQDPRTQVVIVQLRDGQGVHTNFRNLRSIPEAVETTDVEDIQESEETIEYDPEILAIKGISPTIAHILWTNDIKTLEDLKYTSNDVLASLPSFGARHITAIRQVVEYAGERPSEQEVESEAEETADSEKKDEE